MKANVWLIEAVTNIQVGSENVANWGLIDKAIQRDVLTKLPCINGSSFKGALNEYATVKKVLDSNQRKEIFGVDKGLNDTSNETGVEKKVKTQKGKFMFLDASLLLLPVQDDREFYKLKACHDQIENFIALVNMLNTSDKTFSRQGLLDCLANIPHFNKANDIMQAEVFKALCEDDELPVIARNKLENGESKNLWYEQVLPQKTVFVALILSEENALDDAFKNAFDEKIIQIGANATIGCGYCKLKKIF